MTDETKMNKGTDQQENRDTDAADNSGNVATATDSEKTEASKKEDQKRRGENQEKSS